LGPTEWSLGSFNQNTDHDTSAGTRTDNAACSSPINSAAHGSPQPRRRRSAPRRSSSIPSQSPGLIRTHENGGGLMGHAPSSASIRPASADWRWRWATDRRAGAGPAWPPLGPDGSRPESRSKKRVNASLDVHLVPPTWMLSRTTPRQPIVVHRYKHETWVFLPRRRRGSDRAASARETIVSSIVMDKVRSPMRRATIGRIAWRNHRLMPMG
jgi:hypothetical protein